MKTLQKSLEKLKRSHPDTHFVFRYENNINTQVVYADLKLDSIERTNSQGLGIHAFSDKGHMGFACTNDLTKESILETAEHAYNSMKIAGHNDFAKIAGSKHFSPVTDEIIHKDSNKDTPITEIKKLIKKLNSEILSLDIPKGIDLSVKTRYKKTQERRKILRSDGTNIVYEYPYSHLGIFLTGRKDGKVQPFYLADAGNNQEILQKYIIPQVKTAIKLINKSFEAPKLDFGNYKILLGGKVGSVFIHEAFGHTAEADSIKLKSPLAKDSKLTKNEQIAPEYVDVYEETAKFGRGFTPYSEYGLKREKTFVIKDGSIKDFLSDINHFDDHPRGYSRANEYCDIPISRMSNTVLDVKGKAVFDFKKDPLKTKIENIYKDLLDKEIIVKDEKVVYLVGTNGGTVSTAEGTFQFNSNFTFMLHNGKVTQYKGVSFSGKTLSVLAAIKQASKEKDHFYGMCGKINQYIPVLGTAPKLVLLEKRKDITLG
jgi:TldD protein